MNEYRCKISSDLASAVHEITTQRFSVEAENNHMRGESHPSRALGENSLLYFSAQGARRRAG